MSNRKEKNYHECECGYTDSDNVRVDVLELPGVTVSLPVETKELIAVRMPWARGERISAELVVWSFILWIVSKTHSSWCSKSIEWGGSEEEFRDELREVDGGDSSG